MTCTRLDVAYALGVTSRYQENHGEEHWKMVKTMLKYLQRTKDQFLIYGDSELKLEGYTDASFSSDRDDSKSLSSYVFILNGGAVSWKSSKQATIADSVTEAEYIAANVEIQKVDGKQNVVNPFTKALGTKEFDKHKWKLGIKYKSDWL
ncbi:secreted RxLR effector protein 161-like [Nicotiana tomentosiformis]|uniref:secreted RxLR effector protein 161-like n=1 Tax=Nicotiana tomentosiformis TaxID=4098 RepID=UPI00388CC97D